MIFNINNSVRVKLTPLGRRIAAGRWDEIKRRVPRVVIPDLTEDAEGWSSWQLWELMQIFGQYCGADFRLAFESLIEIPMP